MQDLRSRSQGATKRESHSQSPRAQSARESTAPFEAVADTVFRRYGRSWKPGTAAVNRSYLRNQIMPWFGHRPISGIAHEDVQLWFSSLRSTPAAANRALPVLSVIMRQAEIYGYRPENSNPCSGVRRYRCCSRERFLTRPEVRRLGRALVHFEASGPRPAAAIRLLLLTGCRQGEIRTLQWSDYRGGHLYLRDGKAGPRMVWLSSPARQVLDRLAHDNRWVFPAPRRPGPMRSDALHRYWRALSEMADLRDVRLHDLRHSYASIALEQGESIPTIGRLLGHRDPATTLRYTHFADASIHEAVEAVGQALGI
ncbi:MAG: tyrosine-type recombinase/integrase [Bryobacterales bacterium]|nr:tyrosine-type recombinase/integrase [Bryobacterales bacterium]